MYCSIAKSTLFILFSIPVLAACGREKNQKAEELLLGRWDILDAFRNGRPTESLAELYFEFFQDGEMNTNLLGAPETARYELDGSELHQTESQINVDYQILELNDSVLVLSTELRGYAFRLNLRRRIQEE